MRISPQTWRLVTSSISGESCRLAGFGRVVAPLNGSRVRRAASACSSRRSTGEYWRLDMGLSRDQAGGKAGSMPAGRTGRVVRYQPGGQFMLR